MTSNRLFAAFLVGVALFTPPMIAIFGHGGSINGIPLLFLYLFGAWAALAAVLAVIVANGTR